MENTGTENTGPETAGSPTKAANVMLLSLAGAAWESVRVSRPFALIKPP